MTPPYMPATLRSVRLQQGRTLNEVAESSGLHRASVARIETGEITPTIDSLNALLDALGIDGPVADVWTPTPPELLTVRRALQMLDDDARYRR